MQKVPKHLQGILWSTDITALDVERDKWYIIHQILTYGTFQDIQWLFHTYSKKDVARIFVKEPSKTYPKAVFHFVKNFILGLKHTQLDEDAYITSISGQVRPRAAGRV